MGDPRRARKTYSQPRHPWQKQRIVDEKELLRDYGLKNKTEVYKHTSYIKNMIKHYKFLNTQLTEQSTKEKESLLVKAKRYGFVSTDADMSELLNLNVRNVLERRLQSVVVKCKLARTPKQARQFITHRHITVNGVVVDAPSYLVPLAEEATIAFVARSSLFDEAHPERSIEAQKIALEKEALAKAAKEAKAQNTEDTTESSEETVVAE